MFDFDIRYAQWFNSMHGTTAPMPSREYPNSWWAYVNDGHVTKEQDREFWKWNAGIGNYCFWRFLPAYDYAKPFLARALKEFDEVHFVTSRPGERSKKATEDALWVLGVQNPLVIIAHDKPPVLKAIKATHFLDDRDKNFEDCILQSCSAKLMMLDQPWNRHYSHPLVTRISDINEIFD